MFTCLTLPGLTLLTSSLPLADLGRMSLTVGLAIAGVEAMLIAGFFMHVF